MDAGKQRIPVFFEPLSSENSTPPRPRKGEALLNTDLGELLLRDESGNVVATVKQWSLAKFEELRAGVHSQGMLVGGYRLHRDPLVHTPPPAVLEPPITSVGPGWVVFNRTRAPAAPLPASVAAVPDLSRKRPFPDAEPPAPATPPPPAPRQWFAGPASSSSSSADSSNSRSIGTSGLASLMTSSASSPSSLSSLLRNAATSTSMYGDGSGVSAGGSGLGLLGGAALALTASSGGPALVSGPLEVSSSGLSNTTGSSNLSGDSNSIPHHASAPTGASNTSTCSGTTTSNSSSHSSTTLSSPLPMNTVGPVPYEAAKAKKEFADKISLWHLMWPGHGLEPLLRPGTEVCILKNQKGPVSGNARVMVEGTVTDKGGILTPEGTEFATPSEWYRAVTHQNNQSGWKTVRLKSDLKVNLRMLKNQYIKMLRERTTAGHSNSTTSSSSTSSSNNGNNSANILASTPDPH